MFASIIQVQFYKNIFYWRYDDDMLADEQKLLILKCSVTKPIDSGDAVTLSHQLLLFN